MLIAGAVLYRVSDGRLLFHRLNLYNLRPIHEMSGIFFI